MYIICTVPQFAPFLLFASVGCLANNTIKLLDHSIYAFLLVTGSDIVATQIHKIREVKPPRPPAFQLPSVLLGLVPVQLRIQAFSSPPFATVSDENFHLKLPASPPPYTSDFCFS